MGWGGRLFEAGRLLTFSAFRMGAYSRWALIRINTVNDKRVHGWVQKVSTRLILPLHYKLSREPAYHCSPPWGLVLTKISPESFLVKFLTIFTKIPEVIFNQESL